MTLKKNIKLRIDTKLKMKTNNLALLVRPKKNKNSEAIKRKIIKIVKIINIKIIIINKLNKKRYNKLIQTHKKIKKAVQITNKLICNTDKKITNNNKKKKKYKARHIRKIFRKIILTNKIFRKIILTNKIFRINRHL